MALSATPYKVDVNLTDLDRSVFETLGDSSTPYAGTSCCYQTDESRGCGVPRKTVLLSRY